MCPSRMHVDDRSACPTIMPTHINSNHEDEDGHDGYDARSFLHAHAHRRRGRFIHRYSPTHAWLVRASQRALLTGLATPHLGPTLAHVLHGLAWSSYLPRLGGSICMHMRQSSSLVHANDPVGVAHVFPRDPIARGSLSELFHARMHPGLYLGRSAIHGRGLFTAVDLPCGTCVFTESQRTLLATPSYLRLLSDTRERLPDTWHYTHPSGALRELVTQPQPHHVMNHSCAANVCSGLSRAFWPALRLRTGNGAHGHMKEDGLCSPDRSDSSYRAAIGREWGHTHALAAANRHCCPYTCGDAHPSSCARGCTSDACERTSSALSSRCALTRLSARVRHWRGFDNPNRYFVTRAVCAGEELTLNYASLYAPMYAGERAPWVMCRCGSATCTHSLYAASTPLRAYLAEVTRGTRRGGYVFAQRPRASATSAAVRRCDACAERRDTEAVMEAAAPVSCWEVAQELFARGLEDETAVLSCLPSVRPLIQYAWGEMSRLPQLQPPCTPATAAEVSADVLEHTTGDDVGACTTCHDGVGRGGGMKAVGRRVVCAPRRRPAVGRGGCVCRLAIQTSGLSCPIIDMFFGYSTRRAHPLKADIIHSPDTYEYTPTKQQQTLYLSFYIYLLQSQAPLKGASVSLINGDSSSGIMLCSYVCTHVHIMHT